MNDLLTAVQAGVEFQKESANPFVTPTRSAPAAVDVNLNHVDVEPARAGTGHTITTDVPGQENQDYNSHPVAAQHAKPKKFFHFFSKKKKEEIVHEAASPAPPVAVVVPRQVSEPVDVVLSSSTEESTGKSNIIAAVDYNQAFMQEVAKIKGLVNTMSEKRQEVQELHKSIPSLTRTPDIKAAQEKMDKDMSTVKKIAGDAKKSIELLQEDEDPHELDVHSGTDRMRKTIIAGLLTRLKKELDLFRDFEATVRDDYRDVVNRRLRVVTGNNVDEDTVEQMIDSGEAENVFRRAMMSSSTAVVDVLNATQERYEGMVKLHQDLLNLHQMMLDFAVLVHEQGVMIDNIEAQVSRSADYIADATENLLAAKAHKKNKEKFKSAAIGTAGAVGATAVGATALKVAGVAAL